MVKRALLIGCNYIGTRYSLSGCINDVKSVNKILTERYQFRSGDIKILTDENNKTEKPTRANIIKGLNWLVAGIKAGDILFFQYSGHGSQMKDKNGDEEDGLDEVICPLDFERAGFISDDELRAKLVEKIPSNVQLFAIMDCCHSGTVFDLRFNFRNKNGSNNEFDLREDKHYEKTEGDVIVLSGCRDDQTSADVWITRTYPSGALTYCFCEALKNKKYKIKLDELLVLSRGLIRAKKLSDQIPQMSFGRLAKIDRLLFQ